jgi:hypothetical protein
MSVVSTSDNELQAVNNPEEETMTNQRKKSVAPRTKKSKVGHSRTVKNSDERRIEIGIFTLVAYKELRGEHPETGEKYRGLHTVWSGFNEAFRRFFPDENPVEWQNALKATGLITLSRFTGGALLQPTLDLLSEPGPGELEMAARVNAFLPGFLVEHKEKRDAYLAARSGKAAPGKKVGKLSTAERKAHKLAAAGNIDAAIEALGYETP